MRDVVGLVLTESEPYISWNWDSGSITAVGGTTVARWAPDGWRL
jgi:hypothetical protein